MQSTCHEIVETGLGRLCMSVKKDASMSYLGCEAVRRGGIGASGRGRRCRGVFLCRRGIVYWFAKVLRTLGRPCSCYCDEHEGISYNRFAWCLCVECGFGNEESRAGEESGR